MVLDNGLVNVLMVCTLHSGKSEEENESFRNEVFHLVSCIPQNEMLVLAGDDMLEAVMLAMMGHMVVLGMEIGMQIVPGS